MRYSQLFGKTSKTAPHDAPRQGSGQAPSMNAQLLTQGGFIDQVMAGVYTYLPLGLLSLKRIQQIVREEMDGLGGQEILMPALHPKELWAATGRWEDPGPEVMFQLKGRGKKEYGLGWTHEEVVTPLARRFLKSYRDLPLALYQIQDKFRDEPRPKSGLLRGREFSMKDLYSFHATGKSLEEFYERATQAYLNVFQRCGLDAIVTEASGGAFSKYSHEFQVPTEFGEDHIFMCGSCRYAQNRDITEMKVGGKCPKCNPPGRGRQPDRRVLAGTGNGVIEEKKAIEVGNIFKLGTRFSDAFELTYTDEKGKKQPVIMGCYGIGPSRVMGAVVEVHHDDVGILWPESIAPYSAHLLSLGNDDVVKKEAETLYESLWEMGVETLFDDREASPGEKLADADLIGIPVRLVVSKRSLEKGGVEWKKRSDTEAKIVRREELAELFAPGAGEDLQEVLDRLGMKG